MLKFIKKAVSCDPYKNLAFEDALADVVRRLSKEGFPCYGLFLWQSDSAVVFGRNQSIQNECNYELVCNKGVKLVRRKTGGGAVYQDMGNLNFSFIAAEEIYSEELNFRIILKALSYIGINAKVSGRNDIEVSGRKISGNAFSVDNGVCLHHGTLLVCEDAELASELLTPPDTKLKSKGITSVRGRIINLQEISSDVTVVAAEDSIAKAFNNLINAEVVEPVIDRNILVKQEMFLKSKEWLDINSVKRRFVVDGDFGFFRFNIEEDKGRIKKIDYESDILEVELLSYFIKGLEGCAIAEECLLNTYNELIEKIPYNISGKQTYMLNKIIVAIINAAE